VQLYGDLTGVNVMLQAWGSPPAALTIRDVGPQMFEVWRSYWGKFGYGQIALDDALYWAVAILAAVGLIGLGVGRRRTLTDRRTAWTLAAAWLASLLAGLAFAAQNPSGLHGRFLLPAGIVPALAINAGLHGWAPPARPKFDRVLDVMVGAAMFALPVMALVHYLIPTYTPPPLLSAAEVRQHTQPADIQFGSDAVLLGYGAVPRQVRPTERFTVTVCWQTLKPAGSDYYAFVQLTGQANAIVAQRRMFTGMGQRLSSEWSAGEVFCDDFRLNVEAWTPAPRVYALEVGLVDPATGTRLTPLSADGVELAPAILTSLAVQSPDPLVVPAAARRPSLIDFGGQFRLMGSALEPSSVRAGQTVTLTLYWQAARLPDRNYTVFVHVLDKAGRQAAQADAMPDQNRYPTSYWAVDEIVGDPHPIDLPLDLASGLYTIDIGWYELASGARLPMNGDPAGTLEVMPFTIEAAR
jgi:hypothetical protein